MNAARYTAYNVSYKLVTYSPSVDIGIWFVGNIEKCGYESDENTVGCAPVYREGRVATDQTVVQVETGFNEESTVTILKHELGHTLGLGHMNDSSLPFMREAISLGIMPEPDVSERDYKWTEYRIQVYANLTDVAPHARDSLRSDIQAVLDRYNTYQYDKLPDNVTLVLVDSKAEADIVINVVDETPSGRYSEVTVWGHDPDRDGALEYYTETEIWVRDESHDEISDHVGYYIGYALYADEDEDLPGPYKP